MTVTTHSTGLRRSARLPSQKQVKRIIETVVRRERGKAPGNVHVIFVDKTTIRRLNRSFLKTKGDTDVIAFGYESGRWAKGEIPFGDIYISLPQASANAKRFEEPFSREVTRLIVHGMLHLLGYSDHAPRPKAKMWAKQEALVRLLSPQEIQ